MVTQWKFFEKEISEWGDIHKYQSEGWIFRGQRDSEKPLQTSLERACKRHEPPLREGDSIEKQLLREFRRKYHHFAVHIPDPDDSLEWLSLMQHYGAPTRLLDFTYSIYVACYFAIEKTESDCVVWAINGRWANKRSRAVFKTNSIQWRFLKKDITEKNTKDFNKTFMTSRPKAFACPVNPFRLNERLTIQKGVFMVPGNVKLTFEENLKAMDGWHKEPNIMKLVLKKKLRGAALKTLSDMTISRTTLFPGSMALLNH